MIKNNILLKPNYSQKGMTLFETLIVLLLIGFFSAMAIPQFLSGSSDNDLKISSEKIKSIIQESLQRAEQINISCEFRFLSSDSIADFTNYPSGMTENCLTNTPTETIIIGTKSRKQIKMPDGIKLTTNLAAARLTISFQGMIAGNLTRNFNQPGLIVLESSKTALKKCLLIWLIIGFVKTGNYTGKNQSTGVSLNDINPENYCPITR